MRLRNATLTISQRLKLDSHHAIERFGVFVTLFALAGVLVIGGAGISALQAGNDSMARTALYTSQYTTSKTSLKGDVDGIYGNLHRDKVFVMMHFPTTARISYNAADYRAFLLGSDDDLRNEAVSTAGIKGSFHVYGSTGYIGVMLEAATPFESQVLNLTIRANTELTHDERQRAPATVDELADDTSFRRYDQWRIFINPGASGMTTIPSLDATRIDPARAFYDIILKAEEQRVRGTLDQKLLEMRSTLAQVQAYTADLKTTTVDGLFLQPPTMPAAIAGDRVTGVTAAEAKNGASTLTLATGHTVPGGFDFDWRPGNVLDGYLNRVVPERQSYVEFLAEKRSEVTDGTTRQISEMRWTLSDGSDLKRDHRGTDVTLRPLTTVMNNLSQAYLDYAKSKATYQSQLLLDLLRLEVKLRDVRSNTSTRDDAGFLASLY
ncbi:hypothetical protein [Amycolatopsis sp. TNS106]|uniref:hypothetical protein n=1 Tax=Amycolatopsis sp. TNS106 TaxID=2861750 RepID=UPI001C59E293|nr:hypothetical protein [Amycolatopsis sp. TNS106]QXV57373.1 hypothetical protein CVV72_10355 [Amycolatopsis sp. TNS106]